MSTRYRFLSLSLFAFAFLLLGLAPKAQAQLVQLGSPYSSLSSYGIAAGDIDGDGDLDIIESYSAGANAWYANNGSGVFSLGQNFGSGAEESSAVAVADFDKDGKLDVVVANRKQFAATSPTQVYLNSGTALNTTVAWVGSYNEWNDDVAVGDFDNDGFPDMVVTTRTGTVSRIWMNQGLPTGSVAFTELTIVGVPVGVVGVTVGKFNADVYDDIVFGNGSLLLSTGAATFAVSNVGSSGARVDTGDLNNDGDLDLVFTGNYSQIHARLGNGDGTFGAATSFGETGDPRFDADLADINNDGNLDLIIAGWPNGTPLPFEYSYLGVGDGTFTASTDITSGERSIIGADFDGDGDADVATSYPSNILQNQYPGPLDVTNTNDSGAGSLRAAITYANATANGGSPDEITFAIPGGASTIHTIQPLTELPVIAEAVIINATTQGDATCGSFGFNDRLLRVILDGALLPSNGDTGFDVTGGGSTIQGFVVQNMPQHAVRLGSNNNTVSCNYIGTDADGLGVSGPNGRIWAGAGVFIEGSSNTISQNVVVGSSYDEIRVESGLSNTIEFNFAGVDRNVVVQLSPLTTQNPGNQNRIGIVGGNSGTTSGNVVGGFADGIFVNNNETVESNFVGVGPGGESIPNSSGITVGGNNNNIGTGNVVSNNGNGLQAGNGTSGNRIFQNTFSANGANGILLIGTANGNIQPITWGPTYFDSSGDLILNVTAGVKGVIELFLADSQSNGEGETFLANNMTIAAAGVEQQFNAGPIGSVSVGSFLVATLTQTGPTANTSTFSAVAQVAGDPLVVINTNDSGPGSLRAAIAYANGNSGADTISFNIPSGPFVISPSTALPTITEAVLIDGYSQPGATANTAAAWQAGDANILIQVLGNGSFGGLSLAGHSGSTLQGLIVAGFSGNALSLNGSGHTILGNYFGTDGTSYLGAGGISVRGANHVIGGLNPSDRNVVSAGGIGMEPSGDFVTIEGNFIGTNAAGTAIIGTGGQLPLNGLASNQGTDATVTGNLISGARWYGISLSQANAAQGPMSWNVTGNRIGTDASGTLNLGNSLGGARAQKGANDNTFTNNIIAFNGGNGGIYLSNGDGQFAPQGNKISQNSIFSNAGPGIQLVKVNSVVPANGGANGDIDPLVITSSFVDAAGSLNIRVTSAIAGTVEFYEADSQSSGEGKTQFANLLPYATPGSDQLYNVGQVSASSLAVGDFIVATLTTTNGSNNTSEFSAVAEITGNPLTVVTAADSGPGSLRAAMNYATGQPGIDTIVFNISGQAPHTITLLSALPENVEPLIIDGDGGTCSPTKSIVLNGAGLTANGLKFSGATAAGSVIRGLEIQGFDGSGIALANTSQVSVLCNSIHDNTLDGVNAFFVSEATVINNVIYNNSDSGVYFFDGSLNTIQGNVIGLDNTGTVAGNLNGLIISRSATNTVGGPTPAARNVISGNNGAGVIIEFEESIGNTVSGNYIGTTLDGLLAAPNADVGVRVWFGASNNTVGGTATGSENIISGNASHGVAIITPGDEGFGAIHNTTNQILNNYIGLGADGETAVGNDGAGVWIAEGSSQNIVSGNFVSANGGSGVVVSNGGGLPSQENTITQNSTFENGGLGIDVRDTSNGGLVAPLLTGALRQASNVGYVTVDLSGVSTLLTLEFYQADLDNQEGKTFLGSKDVVSGTTFIDLTYGGLLSQGDQILVSATDSDGNTSAFSGPIQVTQAEDATILADQFIDLPDQLTFQISQDLINSVPGVTAAVQAAFDSWNAVSTAEAGTKVLLSGTPSAEPNPILTDGINLVARSSASFPLSANTLAVASKLLAVQGGEAKIISADIIFNRGLLANPSQGLGTDVQPGIWDVQAVAAHEIGHTMGMRHSGVSTATMFFSIPSGKSYRSLEVDDKAWISHRYPSPSATSLGSIAGNITDGELLPGTEIRGALVIARNTTTGNRIHAYTDMAGDFLIPGVPAGDYTISIQPLDGFVDNIPGMVAGTVSPYLASIVNNATFTEENWSGASEGGIEAIDTAATLSVSTGEHVTNVLFVTNLDNVAPTVNGASPTNGGVGVKIRPSISATFSEPIIQNGLSIVVTPTLGGAAVSGSVQVPGTSGIVGTFTLDTGVSLAYGTQYTITISGATDKKFQTQLAPWTSTFTTRAADITAPVLLSSTPANSGSGVTPRSTVVLSFSEAMDVESIKSGITLCKVENSVCSSALGGTWSFPSTTLAQALPEWVTTFQPTEMLDEGSTYRIDVAATVRDQAATGGNVIGAASAIQFMTIPDLDPIRTDEGPADLSNNVSVRTSVFADFSEPMVLPVDGGGATTGIALTNSSGQVAGTVELLNDGKRVIFRPDAPLVFGEDHIATFSSTIEDATGNSIQELTLNFRTAAQPTAVTVATVSPLVSIPGSIVVFSGKGFSATPSLNSIVFSGTNGNILGEVVTSTLSTLSAIVPDGAVAGQVTISSGGQNGSIDLEIYQVIPLLDPAIARRGADSAPRDVEVSPDGGTAFVTNSGAGTVTVLDVSDGSEIGTVSVGKSPLKVALTPDGTRAYVTNFGSNTVSVLDVSNVNYPIHLKDIPVGLNPFGLAISPDGKRLYVAEYTSRKITIIDIEEGSGSADRAIARIGVEINDRNVEEEPDGGTKQIGVESNPRDIEVSPDGGSLFFTTETLGLRVLLLDDNGSADEDAATRRIGSESSTRDVEVSPDGGLIFVTTLEGALEAFRIPPDLNSTSSFQAVARLGKESNSREVEVSPDGGLIYVTNFEAGLVQVYSITSLYTPSASSATGGFLLSFELVTAYSVGDNPEAVVFSAAAQVALVVNSGSDDVTFISFENEIAPIVDTDSDGLNDDEELLSNTDPTNPDSDGDGLTDGQEVNEFGTDPNNPDTDGDSIGDGDEVDNNTDPLVPEVSLDGDMDGLTDDEEILLGTDPSNPDTDGDLSIDGEDLAPLNPNEWYMIDGIHDGRQQVADEIQAMMDLVATGVAPETEDDDKDSKKSKKSDKSSKSKKSDKSSKGDDDSLTEGLQDALDELEGTFDLEFWADPIRITEKKGKNVLKDDQKAVKELLALAKDFGEYEDQLEDWAEAIAKLDVQVVEVLIADATTECGADKKCNKELDKAVKDYDKAIKDMDKGDFDKAISDLQKAWKRAVKLLPGAGKGFDGDDTEAVEADLAEDALLPTEFNLSPNYPNPFNPVTTIEFALPESKAVSLVVYDMLGREVQVLVRGDLQAGFHRVQFNADRLPSGMYLYRLVAGNYTKVQKMVLLK